MLPCQINRGQVYSHDTALVYCMTMYLARDSGGYLCTNSLLALMAAWLDASQRDRDGVQLNRSAREQNVKRFEQS